MSDKVVPVESKPVPQQLELTMESFKDVTKKPLRLLPPELRHEAFKVWNMNRLRFGMDTPLTLSAVLAIWITDHGLTIEDAKIILKQSTHPNCMMNIKNSHDLITEMAKLAGRAIDARARAKTQDEHNRRQQQYTQERASPEVLDKLRGITNDNGYRPKRSGPTGSSRGSSEITEKLMGDDFGAIGK